MRPVRMMAAVVSTMTQLVFWIGDVGQGKAEQYNPAIDPANFTTTIDNPFYPLTPKTTYTFRGVVAEGEELNTVEVTKYTKVILGVTCVVVIDTVWLNGAPQELTRDWFAQDKQGNVWYFGEDAKQYSNGVLVGTEGSWEAGVNGAQPGLVMEAQPQVGDLYRQEYLKGVAEDMAEVLSLTGVADVPYGTFSDCIVTRDFSRLDKKSVENKWYARGIGLVKAMTVTGGTDISELVKVTGPK